MLGEPILLKPCPFCGETPKVKKRVEQLGNGHTRDYFLIKCLNFNCSVNPHFLSEGESTHGHGDIRTNEEAEKLAIEHWNTREISCVEIKAGVNGS